MTLESMAVTGDDPAQELAVDKEGWKPGSGERT